MSDMRYRLGRWLLRPFVRQLYRHYEEESKKALAREDVVAYEHCEYICIGLETAMSRGTAK